jgi:hypothetical protein
VGGQLGFWTIASTCRETRKKNVANRMPRTARTGLHQRRKRPTGWGAARGATPFDPSTMHVILYDTAAIHSAAIERVIRRDGIHRPAADLRADEQPSRHRSRDPVAASAGSSPLDRMGCNRHSLEMGLPDYASAFCFMVSNSACVIAPLSSSCLACAIWSAGELPATALMCASCSAFSACICPMSRSAIL